MKMDIILRGGILIFFSSRLATCSSVRKGMCTLMVYIPHLTSSQIGTPIHGPVDL